MFAFAWLSPTGELWLARDPMGMKPLYYASLDWGVVFASEIKAFLRVPGFTPTLSKSAVRQFLEFGYTFVSRETSLKGVSKLDPGHIVMIRDGVVQKQQRYFFPPSVITDRNPVGDEVLDDAYNT